MGRNAEGLKEALKNLSGKDVDGETKGEILENFNLQYKEVALSLAVNDSAGEAVASPTVVLKKGAVVGSGDAVSAESDGSYKVAMGEYNYSISKAGYNAETGVITIGSYEAQKGEAKVLIVLKTPALVSFDIKDSAGEEVNTLTVVLKKGAVIGSGDVISAEADGSYKCLAGEYNFSVSATGYANEAGTFEITKAQLETAIIKALVMKGPAVVTFEVKDGTGTAVESPTVVLKKGAVIGSGDVISAEADGSYKCLAGEYNFSVSATGYANEAGTFEITKAQLETAIIKALVMKGPAVVTFEIKDAMGEAVDSPTVVLKKGAVVGSGDAVSAESDGSYLCLDGEYNFSVSASEFITKTGTLEITREQLETAVIEEVVLEADNA